jgi:serine protease Do
MGAVRETIAIRLILLALAAVIGLEILLLLADGQEGQAASNLWLGVETMELTPAVAGQYDLGSWHGLLISRVFVDSPAYRAGVKTGDVLRRWNGKSVTTPEQLQTLLSKASADKQVKLTVIRQGAELPLRVLLGPRPGR